MASSKNNLILNNKLFFKKKVGYVYIENILGEIVLVDRKQSLGKFPEGVEVRNSCSANAFDFNTDNENNRYIRFKIFRTN